MTPRRGVGAGGPVRGTPSADIEEFLLHIEKERQLSPHTVKAYRRDDRVLLVGNEDRKSVV